jgi:hypothetical protein
VSKRWKFACTKLCKTFSRLLSIKLNDYLVSLFWKPMFFFDFEFMPKLFMLTHIDCKVNCKYLYILVINYSLHTYLCPYLWIQPQKSLNNVAILLTTQNFDVFSVYYARDFVRKIKQFTIMHPVISMTDSVITPWNSKRMNVAIHYSALDPLNNNQEHLKATSRA